MKASTKNTKGRHFAMGLAIGIPIGTPLGLVFGNLALGPAIGVAIGLILGWVLSIRDTNNEEVKTAGKGKIWIYTLIFGIIVLVETFVMIKLN
ncbi:hypothetical protein G3570_09435 [Balneolaceae bacterium YR4-1]|uniref:Glycine zipper-like domain-containing protein n=1 Tax=Halalkalibaculum roseum TaxID=2709311 RepID=A0A6M1T039_9BACT|nr:hypothetical protein [Halalkalibaculum roseum]NGP76854.1 hypothetical protein [Halalkalibaculum roseum]